MGSIADAYRLMLEAKNKVSKDDTSDQNGDSSDTTNSDDGDTKKDSKTKIDELSKATLGSYIKKSTASLTGISSNMAATSVRGGKAHPDDKRQFGNRLTGVHRATNKLTKESSTDWPVYSRIVEKAKDEHTKGALPAQPHGDNWSGKDKEVVAKHGGPGPYKPVPHIDDHITDAGPHNNVANVKVAPKRHNDSTIGDKAMPKLKQTQ